jgi:formylglycine-generating enzyme required for sulfatase activity
VFSLKQKECPEPPSRKYARTIKNSIGMKLVRIPPGKFTMGSPKDQKRRHEVEEQHEVTIQKAFYLGMYEVKQRQFREVMGYNPSCFAKNGKAKKGAEYTTEPGEGKEEVKDQDTDAFPVENVSYEEAVEFCKKLTALAAEKWQQRVYRLPTEAEWEYACRGGPRSSSKPFHFKSPSDSLGAGQANFDARFPYGGGKAGEEPTRTNTVGKNGEPNALGLHDMHGNVWEWCSDWYNDHYYKRSPREDPKGPGKGKYRVLRGGSWLNQGNACRAAYRSASSSVKRKSSIGFRVACDIAAKAP